MKPIVHRWAPNTIDALCGRPHSERMLYASLRIPRRMRWCLDCQRKHSRNARQGDRS